MPSTQTHLAAQDRRPALDAGDRDPPTTRSSQLAEENRAPAESLRDQSMAYEDFALKLTEQIDEFGIITSRAQRLAAKTRSLLRAGFPQGDADASSPRSAD